MTTPQARPLACLEVWGGNRSLDQEVALPGLDAWLYSRPHPGSTAGGDLYYLSVCDKGALARVSVADVSGHGQSVSRLAERLRELMRKHISTFDQSEFVRELNQAFQYEVSRGKFATAVLVGLHAPSGQMVLTNGGHPPPLWYRAPENQWLLLEEDAASDGCVVSGLPLGVIPGTDYHQTAVQLQANDLVLLYSDGLLEARNPAGALLNKEGLLELARALPTGSPVAAGRALLAAVAGYRCGTPAQDDETVVALRRLVA